VGEISDPPLLSINPPFFLLYISTSRGRDVEKKNGGRAQQMGRFWREEEVH
jgi:hypothetical protein